MEGAGGIVAGVGIGVLVLFALYVGTVARYGAREQREPETTEHSSEEPSDPAADALLRTLLHSDLDATLSGRDLLETDGKLHRYVHGEVDWNDIWDAARKRSAGVPPFGVGPFWSRRGPGGSPTPQSVLAFWGASARLRIARDPSTDRLTLAMLAGAPDLTGMPTRPSGDPDPTVRDAAARRF